MPFEQVKQGKRLENSAMNLPARPSVSRPRPPQTPLRAIVPTYLRYLFDGTPISLSATYMKDMIYPSHPWNHAMMKVKKVLEWTQPGGTEFDEMTGRCWQGGRNHNCIVAQLVDLVQKKTRTNFENFQPPVAEIRQLRFLKKHITAIHTTKAGLHYPQWYKPGRCQKEDSKMLMAAAFFVESEPDQLPQNTSEQPNTEMSDSSSLKAPDRPSKELEEEAKNLTPVQEHKSKESLDEDMKKNKMRRCDSPDPPSINYTEQAMLKMDKWTENWLTGKLGFTNAAWESFEFCLSTPDSPGIDENVNCDVQLLTGEPSANSGGGESNENSLLLVKNLFAQKLSAKRPISITQHEVVACNNLKRAKISHSSAPRVESNSKRKVYSSTQRSDSPVTFTPFLKKASLGSSELGDQDVSITPENQSYRMVQGAVQTQAAPGSLLEITKQSQVMAMNQPPTSTKSSLSLIHRQGNTVVRFAPEAARKNGLDSAIEVRRTRNRLAGLGFIADRTPFTQHRTPASILQSSPPD